MNLPVEASSPQCPAGCGVGAHLCPSECETRWAALQRGLEAFVASAPPARLGLVTFPSDTQCSPANQIRVNIPSADAGTEAAETARGLLLETVQKIQSSSNHVHAGGEYPVGGTPIGPSLRWVRDNLLELRNPRHASVVVLITDGVPNCNPVHPATSPETCQCSLSSASTCSPAGQPLFAEGCLDAEGAVQAIRDLESDAIRTVVVAYGADVQAGAAHVTLDAMAEAGGMPLSCPNGTDAECGGPGNPCDASTGRCARSYYRVSETSQLSSALSQACRRAASL